MKTEEEKQEEIKADNTIRAIGYIILIIAGIIMLKKLNLLWIFPGLDILF